MVSGRERMTTSPGTALRRLQQSDARDHHHAEYANGFHVFNVRLNFVSANRRSIFCVLHFRQRGLSKFPFFVVRRGVDSFSPRAQTRLPKELQNEEIILDSFSLFRRDGLGGGKISQRLGDERFHH
jgi:hypothetical protein